MALPSKPSIKNVWATSGTKVEPSDAKVNTGWIVERPPHQFQNFLQNRSDQFLKHINEAGIPVWDAVTVYTAGKSYVQGGDGKIYKSLTSGFNQNPVGNPTNWALTFGDLDVQEYADQALDSATAAAVSEANAADSEATALSTLAVFDDVPPASPLSGRRWTSDITGKTYEWIVDVDGGQWVETGSAPTVSATAIAVALSATNGATLVGTPTGTVQAALDARPTLATLGGNTGADLIGIQQPGTGAALRDVAAKFAEIVTITDYAQGDGDDAMQARAVAYCKTLPVARLVVPPGNYTATDTWVFDLPSYSSIEFLGRITSSVSAKPAIRIGSSSSNLFGYYVTGIEVVRTSNDTSSGSIGVEIANLVWSKVHVRRAEGFTDGVLCNGTQSNGGVSYLDLTMGLCYNNKKNLRFTASSVGYCNEINVYGGRFGYSSGYPDYTATANVTIDHFAGNRLNNIRFFGPSFEAVNAATRAAVISGRYCLIVHPRMENPADSLNFAIELTSNSEGCIIAGKGFGLNSSNIIDAGVNNSYVTKQTSFVRNEAGVDVPILYLQSNASNSAYSAIGKTTSGTTGWSIRQSGQLYSASNGYYETGIRWATTSGTFTDRGLFTGTGSPEGVVTASVGSLYSRKDGGANTTLYVKETGTGNTGWVAK